MAKTKTNAEMLVCIKQYNKVAREAKAKKEGFTSAAALISYLEGEIKAGRRRNDFTSPSITPVVTPDSVKKVAKVTKKVVSNRPVIHVADILDSSGSMGGRKIIAAIEGINLGIKQLKEDTNEIDYTYTLCDFSDDIIFREVKTKIKHVNVFKGGTRGSTSLFDAIGDTIEKIKIGIKDDCKVLVNIYTDGQENSSRRYRAPQINTLIKNLSEQGWTFTFIGTDQDVSFVKNNLSIADSNTLVYDGTGEGLEKSFSLNSEARTAYSSKVSRGEDVIIGFYKDIN